MNKRIIKEYCTPDGLDIEDVTASWSISDAYPFVMTDAGLVIGRPASKHRDMIDTIIAKLCGTDESIVKAIKKEDYGYDEETDTYWVDDEEIDEHTFSKIYYFLDNYDSDGSSIMDNCDTFGRIWYEYGDNYETYISLWLNNRFDIDGYYENSFEEEGGMFDISSANNPDESFTMDFVPSSLGDYEIKVIKMVLDRFKCDYNNSFVCIGDTMIVFSKILNGEDNIALTNDDYEKFKNQREVHLKPAEEKWKDTEDFRNNRDAMNAQKLITKDNNGNFKSEMPMAQYKYLLNRESEERISNIITEKINNFVRKLKK